MDTIFLKIEGMDIDCLEVNVTDIKVKLYQLSLSKDNMFLLGFIDCLGNLGLITVGEIEELQVEIKRFDKK